MLPPYFLRGEGVDALAEYREFLNAVGEAASHLFAEFAEIQEYGPLSRIPDEDSRRTQVRNLLCRHVDNWVVFYLAMEQAGRRQIWVVLVGSLNPHPFEALESEAESRMRDLVGR